MNSFSSHGLVSLWVVGFDLVLAWAAVYVALELSKRLDVVRHREFWVWLVGASTALATGIWSAQVVGLARQDLPYALGYEPFRAAGAWLVGVLAGVAGLGIVSRRDVAPGWAPAGALVLAIGLVLAQALLMYALGLEPGIDWHPFGVGAALVCSAVGCWLALWFFARQCLASSGRAAQLSQGLAALWMAAGFIVSQRFVTGAAGLNHQAVSVFEKNLPQDTMVVLAIVGTFSVLAMLLQRSLFDKRLQVFARSAQGELQTHSLRDSVTALPNRQMFEGTLAQAVVQADAKQGRLALLLINLDAFKPVNEAFGHRIGDRLLSEVAKRLRSIAPPHMAARLGSDEFVLLLPSDPGVGEAAEMATRILDQLGRPFRLESREAKVTCSIGVAMYPQHGAQSTLIGHADAAMRAAKMEGGATYCFFEERMVSGVRDQTELLRDLRVALAQGELELYYQPKIHAPTGEVTGAEALMRWHHPRRGMISPTVFIPIAERFGLISAMGNWLIEEACRQIRAWRDTGLRMRVAINVSVHQLRQSDLVDRIACALQKNGINPNLLTCEITESVAMEDTEGTIEIFKRLTAIGVSISIDDFGTGHSSLAYLSKLPASELKIDRGFVLDLETSDDARTVAQAVINLAKALNLKVVAEGVETEGQNRILREFGCDQLQGYLFSKPLSAKALALWATDNVGPRALAFRQSLFSDTTHTRQAILPIV